MSRGEAAPAVDVARVRYAQVWEDPRVLRAALRVQPGERVFSLAAAGDNAFALLLDDPAEVVAVDYSPAQIALVELKRASLRTLDDDALHAFLGVRPSAHRHQTYASLRAALSPRAQTFWDAHPRDIEEGVLHAGRFERYFRLFRRLVLPLVQSPANRRAYLAAPTLEAQRRLFAERWDNVRWRVLFRLFFSRFLLGRLGRDPSLFAHIDVERVSEHFLARAACSFCEVSSTDNYFAEYILRGGYSGNNGLPPYLDPASLPLVRARLDRLRLVESDMVEALRQETAFDAFNLSDCFEWMPQESAAAAYGAVLKAARPGARLCYWNLLARRSAPATYAAFVDEERELADALHATDRAFFYDRLVIEQLRTPLSSSPSGVVDVAGERRDHAASA